MAEEEKPKNNAKGFKLLGILDIQKTPCARESLLNGAGGSLAFGLIHFLATSRVKRSFDVGFGGFVVTTLGTWFYCRIQNAQKRVEQRRLHGALKNMVTYEGTPLDPDKQGTGTSSPGTS